MRARNAFLSLPSSLLLLLATQLECAQADDTSAAAGGRRRSDYNRNDGSTGSAAAALPTAVRKMSPDEGEKFMPSDYAFAPLKVLIVNDDLGSSNEPRSLFFTLDDDEEGDGVLPQAVNGSTVLAFSPPFPRHYDLRSAGARRGGGGGGTSALEESGKEEESRWSLYRRTSEVLTRLRDRRSFMCPGGTHVCSNINEPNYCCTDGTTCFVVDDAPDSGNVGCCPDGQTCGGSVAACADGNMACPAEDGGGCCVAGFVCADIGCESFSLFSSVSFISCEGEIKASCIPTTSSADDNAPTYS